MIGPLLLIARGFSLVETIHGGRRVIQMLKRFMWQRKEIEMGAGGVINDDVVAMTMKRLTVEEGFTATVKKDIYGNDFIGFGFTPSRGISRFAATALLQAQVDEICVWLEGFDWFKKLDTVRKSVLVDIALNAGERGLLKFHRMLGFLEDGNWESAAKECAVADEKLDVSRYKPLRELLLKGAGT
jgi:hypothetical protein